MSMPIFGGVSTSVGGRLTGAGAAGWRARVWGRVSVTLWPVDRGIGELRWGAVTLCIMVALGLVATTLDPIEGDFLRLLAVAVPAAAALTAAGWSPAAPRLGGSRGVRLAVGPFVLAIALIGAGLAEVETLAIPSAAPFVVLAMAYAAMTPGYPIAAAVMGGASAGILIAHWQITQGVGLEGELSDEFVVGAVVTLIASAGMAGVLRVATKAEARATTLAAQRRERLDALETLNGIIARFDGSQSVASVIQDVVDDIAREFEITLVSMYVPAGRDRLTMVGVAGYPNPFQEMPIGVGIIGRAAATLQTQFVPDVLADPDYRAARDDVRSEVAAPVVHGDELLGVVNFEGTADRPIGPAQVALAEMVVHSLSAALRSARLDDERRQRLHAIERVLAVSRSLVADLDRARIVGSITDVVADLLDADVVALFSRRTDGVYRLEAGVGVPSGAIGLEAPIGNWLIERCVAERTRIEGQQDVAAWPPEFVPGVARVAGAGSPKPHAAMALPIVVGDAVAAVLVVTRAGADRAYSELERRIADLLTAQIAIALQNADLHARVADSALRDPLTGLLNRRFFDEAVETAHANARRARTELSLIVLDLDRFSAVNNEHGHAVGDAVLRRVALAIKGAVREGDVVVRYGGEEFVVIAPATDGDGAVLAAERIRAAVAATASELVDGRLVPLTISAGVASLVDEADGRGLFRAADSALLAAKRAGRDRVSRI
jgi:diguanylate cyclase (GGDEF)-like protein